MLHGAATVYISQPASADLEVRARLPRQLDLHVAGRWEDLSRLNAVRRARLRLAVSAIQRPRVDAAARKSFHDSFAFWAGVEQAETGQFARFGARLGFETSSLDDDDTTAMVIAPRSYTADVGVQLRLALGITLQATYGVQYFPTVNVTDSAFDPRSVINCIASDYDYATSACASTRNSYGIESADGSYQRWEQTFRVMLRRDL